MKKLIIISTLLILSICLGIGPSRVAVATTPPTITWLHQFGTSSADYAYGVAVDGSGNTYVAGYTSGAFTGQTSLGGQDAFVIKYDSLGNAIWTRQFGTSDYDYAYGVAVDGSGNAYVIGHTGGTISGATSSGPLFVRKYDSSGNALWTCQFGTTGTDSVAGVAVDGSGNVYVAGAVYSGNTISGATGTGSLFVRKFDSSGNAVWTRQFGTGNNNNYAHGIAVDNLGNIYVVGSVVGTITGAIGSGDLFISKFGTSGNMIWTGQFGTNSSDENACSIAVDGAGNAYVAGNTSGVFAGQTSSGGKDAYIVKYDSLGNAVWTRQFGTTNNDYAYSIAVDSVGNSYVAGATSGTFTGQTPSGGTDAFIAKYDSSGNAVWARQFGTNASGEDQALGVAVDGSGNAYVAGYFAGTFIGQTSLGGTDAFVAKFGYTFNLITSALPNGEQTAAYPVATNNSTLQATGGTTPYTWYIIGSLPAGLTLNSGTGAITGSPSTTGTTNFLATVVDSKGGVATQPLSITITPLVAITTNAVRPPEDATLPGYNQPLTATLGIGPWPANPWLITSGTLPPGLTMDTGTGIISGTPASGDSGVYNFTIQVTDGAGKPVSKAFSITINALPAITTNSPLAPWDATLSGYNQTVTGTLGTVGATNPWSIPTGALPPGLTLNVTTGVISGTPSIGDAGLTYPFTLQLTDKVGATNQKSFSVSINPLPSITSVAPPTAWDKGIAGYSFTTAGTGGTGSLTFSSTGLPAGITITSAGSISGIPTSTGTFTGTLKVTDTLGVNGTQGFSIIINPQPSITSGATPAWDKDLAGYNFTVTGTGGTGALIFAASGLPAGLTINPGTSAISGSVSTTGVYPGSLIVTDSLGGTSSQGFSVVVNPKPAISSPAPIAWSQNLAGFAYTLTTTGGTGKCSFTASGLPPGLTLDSATGGISGTPSSMGSFNATFTVTDSIGSSSTQAYTLAILAPTYKPNTTAPTTNSPPATIVSGPSAITLVVPVPQQPMTFDWVASWTAVGITYTLQISQDPNFGTLTMQQTGITTNSYTMTTAQQLANSNKPYYWRVQDVDAAGNAGTWSAANSFTLGSTLPPWMLYGGIGLGVALILIIGLLARRRISHRQPVT